MKRTLLALSFMGALLSTSCVSVDYLGKSYSPTAVVDLYFDEADIEKNYEVMGTMTAEMPDWMSMEKMQEKMVEKAREKGADALIIGKIEKQVTGSTSTSSGGQDGNSWGGTTTTSTERVKVVSAQLVKYK